MRDSTRRGLTLIELLAATMILSAVVAAGVAVLKEARAAMPDERATREALSVLERWRVESRQEPDEPWQWASPEGERWRVRVEEPDAQPDADDHDDADPLRLKLQWAVIRVERSDERGEMREVLALPVLRRAGAADAIGAEPHAERRGRS